MARVHATAVVEAGAALADDVEVGAFALIGAHVRIGALVGLAQSIAIGLSVMYAPNEWPWSYWLMAAGHVALLLGATGRWGGLDAAHAQGRRPVRQGQVWAGIAGIVGLVALVGSLDDPFAAPNVDGIRAQLEAAGIKTVYKTTYAIDTKNFDSIVAAMKSANPDLVVHGATFEDGVSLTRSMLKSGWTPKMFYETSTPSFADQYVQAVGEENTEGVMYAVSYSPDADTPGNASRSAPFVIMAAKTGVVSGRLRRVR